MGSRGRLALGEVGTVAGIVVGELVPVECSLEGEGGIASRGVGVLLEFR